jgi:rhodanese-related sulfurtransferase
VHQNRAGEQGRGDERGAAPADDFAWRLTPAETVVAFVRGALLIDIRTDAERAEQGRLPGSIVLDPTVLESRLVPGGEHSLPRMTSYDVEVVLVSRRGTSSSQAAAWLRGLGLWRATDLAGGFEAWLDADLPVGVQQRRSRH